MYVISQKDINLLLTNKEEFNKKLKEKTKDDKVVDIENFKSIKSITIFLLESLLPMMHYDSIFFIQFYNKDLKLKLDFIIKKYYLRIKYEGLKGKTRQYRVHP